ncbi:c-type cytochrome [Aquabacterium sp.]|uniref:c-type cytochrome n=1 Tax=Aquabacterium sp. TaxID=1872578 RepID=UPI0019C1C39C|nr:c-type cytochrome [Aquabacterium sp.]MBC7701886.1 cytochrome c5 family protein [Aquabacterium sp.]
MSQAPNSHDDDHEGPIKTPKQLAVAVGLAFIVPIIVIIMLVMYVVSSNTGSSGSDALSEQATAHRIRPVASVEVKVVSANAGPRSGEEVFKAQCATCHASGALGAPKLGDAAAWGPRIGAGLEALIHSALKGKNAMPPQAGGEFSDLEVGRATAYMANAGGAKFTEPAAPAAAASAASAPASDAK